MSASAPSVAGDGWMNGIELGKNWRAAKTPSTITTPIRATSISTRPLGRRWRAGADRADPACFAALLGRSIDGRMVLPSPHVRLTPRPAPDQLQPHYAPLL